MMVRKSERIRDFVFAFAFARGRGGRGHRVLPQKGNAIWSASLLLLLLLLLLLQLLLMLLQEEGRGVVVPSVYFVHIRGMTLPVIKQLLLLLLVLVERRRRRYAGVGRRVMRSAAGNGESGAAVRPLHLQLGSDGTPSVRVDGGGVNAGGAVGRH